jgi:Flp pilus assembly pilin Flp
MKPVTYLQRVRRDLLATKDRGASALEWALIAAVVVVAAALIGAAVYNVIESRAAQVQECGTVGPGGTC